jgi:putative peptidoglycan lipid II flippase
MVAALFRVGKDLMVAAWFGTHAGVDVYVLALAIPLFVTSVMAGSLASAFVPVYMKLLSEEGEAAAEVLTRRVAAASALALGAASCALLAFGPALMHTFMKSDGLDQIHLIDELARLSAPVVFANGLSLFAGGVLNARGAFALPALTPVLASVIPVALAAASAHPTIELVTLGTVAGYLMEFVVLTVAVVRGSPRREVALKKGVAIGPSLRVVLRSYLPMCGGMLVSSASPLVDQVFASRLGSGSVATLSYATKVPAFMMTLGAGAVGAAVLPLFSQLVASGDRLALTRALRTWAWVIALVYVPAALFSATIARPIIRLVFERGAFGPTATAATIPVFLAFLPQMPFYVLGILGTRLLAAVGRNRAMMFVAFVNVAMNLVGDLVFGRILGVPGLALSTSVVSLTSTGLIFWLLRDVVSVTSTGAAS